MPAPRWFAVGSADAAQPDPGMRAVDEALVPGDAKLLVVFCSPACDLAELLAQIRTRSAAPVIGCTTAGEIATSGPNEASVVVAAFGGDGFEIGTAAATEASKDLRQAGARAARCLPSRQDRPYRVLLLLTDGLAGDQQEVVRGAYGVVGASVPLVGGSAGDDLQMARTFQLYDDQVLTDAVVAAGITADAPLGIGVRHGWRRVGEPMLVTRSSANRVYTLDDRPALDVYLKHLGPGIKGVPPTEESFPRLALTHPFGLGRPSGEEQVRFIGDADFTDGSLRCFAQIPQGALVWTMQGDADSVLAATDAACRDALAALDGRPPLGMLAFDCIARRGVLGDQGIHTEIQRLAAIAGQVPVAGFYTYGEIARTHGMRGFHNQTLVVLSIS